METWHDTWLRSVGTTTQVQGTGLLQSDPAEVGIFKFATVIYLFVQLLSWSGELCDLGHAVWPWMCVTLWLLWPWRCCVTLDMCNSRTCCVAQMCMALKMCATSDMLCGPDVYGLENVCDLGHAVWPRCVWPWKCVRPRTCCLYSTHMVHLHITRPILCLILYLTSGPRLQAEGCSSHMFNLCHSQGSAWPCALLSFCIHTPVQPQLLLC